MYIKANTVRLLMMILLAVAVGIISSCAGTARGKDTSTFSSRKTEEIASQEKSDASALVVIRYPAMIHANAENLYVSSFAINAIGGDVPYAVHGNRQTSRIAQSIIEKSSYYAMSLYRELKNNLPEGSVLLSPHIVDWNKARSCIVARYWAPNKYPVS